MFRKRKNPLDQPLLTWPSGDAYTIADMLRSMAIFGATGTGKSSASALGLVRSILRTNAGGLDKGEEGQGSGVIIDDGLILTACHVIAGCENRLWVHLPVRRDGAVVNTADHYRRADALAAAVIATDTRRDLALLRLCGKGGRPMALAAKSPSPGDAVFTVGGDELVAFRFASGHVRSVGPATAIFADHDVSARMISNTVPLNIGDSGGALIGRDGRLVGINSYIETDKQAVNNCIDISEIKAFLAGVKR